MVNNIPIIGEIKIGEYALLVNVTCSCGRVMMLRASSLGATVVCECRRAIQLTAFRCGTVPPEAAANATADLTIDYASGYVGEANGKVM